MEANGQIAAGGLAPSRGKITDRRWGGADGVGNLGIRHAEALKLGDSFGPGLHDRDPTVFRNRLSTANRNGNPLQFNPMTIGERIRQARDHGPASKVSRKELAAAAGIAYSTLADVENGLSSSTSALHRIAKRLKVRIEWLETGKGPMESAEPDVSSQSHSLRLDPAKVAETHRALRELEKAEGRDFNIESDPVRFVQAYELRCSMSAETTQDEWIQFGAKLSAIRPPQGATKDGREDGVPTQGNDAGRVAAGLRRKAGSQGGRR